MAYAVNFITEAELVKMCGNKAHADVKVANFFEHIIIKCDGIVAAASRFDWTAYHAASPINAAVLGIVAEAGASLAAIEGVKYDMSSYTSRFEAEDIITVLRDRALFCIQILRNKNVQTFVTGA